MKPNFILLPLLAISLLACNPSPQSNATQQPNNEVINAIMARRSIRQYHATPVSRDTLMQIMTCGINAANGQNKQSWEVRIVDKTELLSQMSEAMGEAHGGN